MTRPNILWLVADHFALRQFEFHRDLDELYDLSKDPYEMTTLVDDPKFGNILKEMRLVLTAAHRSLHNRMHRKGRYHDHTPTTDHAEHH